MQRGFSATDRWTARLGIAAVVSLAIHTLPWAVARRLPPLRPVSFEYNIHVVEIGLEAERPGARPRTPPTTQLRTPDPPRTPTPPAPRAAQRPPPAHRAPPPPASNDDLPPWPTTPTDLREPALALAHRPPRLVDPVTGLLDHADAGTPTPPAPVTPSLQSSAAELLPLVPRGALVTVTVRGDRLRGNPNATAIRRMLTGIPDWEQMLGGTDLDPLRDLDEIVLASSRPIGDERHAPDWFVVARAADNDSQRLRRAIEQMATQAAVLAPSPVAPPRPRGNAPMRVGVSPLFGQPLPGTDGGVPIWQPHVGGGEIATFERYGARRSFVMLGDGLAAIAMPEQVDRLFAAMSRRAPGLVSQGDPRIVLQFEADGVRNLIDIPTLRGPFPMPRRAAAVIYQVGPVGGPPSGAAELLSVLQYDSLAQAQGAETMLNYSRTRWHAMITERAGARGGLGRMFSSALAGLVGIDLDSLESSIDALEWRVEGDRVVVRANLTDRQVRAILNASAIGR